MTGKPRQAACLPRRRRRERRRPEGVRTRACLAPSSSTQSAPGLEERLRGRRAGPWAGPGHYSCCLRVVRVGPPGKGRESRFRVVKRRLDGDYHLDASRFARSHAAHDNPWAFPFRTPRPRPDQGVPWSRPRPPRPRPPRLLGQAARRRRPAPPAVDVSLFLVKVYTPENQESIHKSSQYFRVYISPPI